MYAPLAVANEKPLCMGLRSGKPEIGSLYCLAASASPAEEAFVRLDTKRRTPNDIKCCPAAWKKRVTHMTPASIKLALRSELERKQVKQVEASAPSLSY